MKDMPNNRVPIEKKMELAQYIRNENMGNRMKIRQREKILYGTENNAPLWEKRDGIPNNDYLAGNGITDDMQAPSSESTFKFRMAAAIMLFIAFLLCDAGDYKLFGYSMNDIYGMISEDYFQVYDNSDKEDVTTQLTELLQLDFEK